jgi:hypothetical protein
LVDKGSMIKMRKELEDSNTGWDFKQYWRLFKREQVSNTTKYIYYRLLHKWVFLQRYLRKDL